MALRLESIENRVNKALEDNPYISRYDVMVDAHLDWVILTGTVNNPFEKMFAKAEARLGNQTGYSR